VLPRRRNLKASVVVGLRIILPVNVPVVAATVLGVVAPTVPLMFIELTPVNVLFNPRIEAPEVP
jgi:hypothetical protein